MEPTPWPHLPPVTRERASRGSRTPALLTGHGTYVDDIVRPGMLHACFVRSPFAHARINSIDASAALALPGVHAVLTAADLNNDVQEAWHAVQARTSPPTPPRARHWPRVR